ncbi:MAG: UV DNA damage repair endonuclease UvsE [Candidatus Thermoplasmatota archaeon]|nr:UV DNA damage repair endonuclease UvsE [Candidatus Thermoplasmatota archaeon]
MKIGYPCINRSLSCKGDRTFRLKSYSEERFRWTVENNLNCLQRILEFNQQHGMLFFRITSDLIPFASHLVCTFPWQEIYRSTFEKLGGFIKKNQMRISMHPDQFIVLNSPRKEVVERSIAELIYHAEVLDLLGLDSSAKIQLHLGGVYGDTTKSMQRFIDISLSLDDSVKRRLVIENDDRSYRVSDCLTVNKKIDVPVLFDYFHHCLLHRNEAVPDVLADVSATWSTNDGIPMVDYSSQKPHEKPGRHTDHIDRNDFGKFIEDTKLFDFDVMLEIKDKEKSALQAVAILSTDKRFLQINNQEYRNHGSRNPL